MVGVIEYDAGNISSVMRALKFLGKEPELTNDPDVLKKCDHVVFPGVGAYFSAMESLRKSGLVETIREIISAGTPFLGICLGQQLLFDESEEIIGSTDTGAQKIEGLKILRGSIKRFKEKEGYKIPHMGWNSLQIQKQEFRLFEGIDNGSFVYFVHSYYLEAEENGIVAAKTDYINTFDSSVEKDNIFACQFHPEKSGDIGLEILKNFCRA
ncbi:MAG: imidazole glycerol phosphate synthase subunit HisH [Lachnospiraceae bacterium]|nr:imidazole glycerol phosphate synthase subunit HisH [Lachnospiraceae bacterium]